MVGILETGELHLRDVALGAGSHTGNDGYTTEVGFDDEGALRGNGVDGIDNEIKRSVEQGGNIVLREKDRKRVECQRRVDGKQTLLHDVGFQTAYGSMRGRELAVDIRGLHGIGIYKRHLANAGTAKHLSSIGSHTSDANHKDVGTTQALHLIGAKKLFRSLLPRKHKRFTI